MKKKSKIFLVSTLLGASIGFSVAAASCGGDYALTGFVVDRSEIALSYEQGATVDLTKLKMTATFSDETTENVEFEDVKIYLDGVDITSTPSKITETVGEKTITVTYKTKYGEKSQTFKITVTEIAVILDEITDFNKPVFLASYETEKARAADEDTTANESVFFTADAQEYYVVGDDNAFKFLPVAECADFETGDETTLTSCMVNTTVKLVDGAAATALTKLAKEGVENVYEYKQGDTLFITENAAKNEYTFAADALGKVFTISVMPDSNTYTYSDDIDPVSITVQVVDGYNVYNAVELAIVDNLQTNEWAAIKGANGLTNVTTNGVILHQNTLLTPEMIPEAFQYTLADSYNVKYKDMATGEIKTPEDFGLTRTYLYDFIDIYKRKIEAGKSFGFYGNYFSLDVSALPLVAAFEPTKDKDGEILDKNKTYYKDNFSNSTLFFIEGDEATMGSKGDADEKLSFTNIAVKGNAKTQQLVISEETGEANGFKGTETLVYGGGLILTKAQKMEAKYENVRTYHFFISMFAQSYTGEATVSYNKTKCYDSFQDALYVWGNATVNITNSYFKRAGGPVIIMNHVAPDEDGAETRIPTVHIDNNSVLEAWLDGTEVWFKSVGADSLVGQISQGANMIVGGVNKSITKDGKMNIVALLMRDATDAATALGAVETEGLLTYEYGEGDDKQTATLDRMSTSLVGQTMKSIMQISTEIPVLNIGQSVYYAVDPQKGILKAGLASDAYQESGAAFNADSAKANYVGFNKAGISILFGYYADTVDEI